MPTPPTLTDRDGTDVGAWLCTVPEIPADWPLGPSESQPPITAQNGIGGIGGNGLPLDCGA